jgi:protein-tyrosine phosphatase
MIELPKVFELAAAKDGIFVLCINGYIPILEHPERHSRFQLDFECLKDFIEMLAYCQITAANLTGGFGRNVIYLAEKMVLYGLAHVIGSDSHGSNLREPMLSTALKKAASLLGSEKKAKSMVVDIPSAIIADQDIAIEIPGKNSCELRGNTGRQSGKSGFLKNLFLSWIIQKF